MTEVTCAIILKNGKVLLTQRSESMSHPGRWEFPGGKLKALESPENCVIRELREELDAEVNLERRLPAVKYDYDHTQIRLIPFICTLASENIVLRQHMNLAWVTIEEISEFDMLEADLRILGNLESIWS